MFDGAPVEVEAFEKTQGTHQGQQSACIDTYIDQLKVCK